MLYRFEQKDHWSNDPSQQCPFPLVQSPPFDKEYVKRQCFEHIVFFLFLIIQTAVCTTSYSCSPKNTYDMNAFSCDFAKCIPTCHI